jgi:hypothetical protein
MPRFCEAFNEPCEPTRCRAEFCRWRDKWILTQLSEWAYSGGRVDDEGATDDRRDSESD